MIQSLLLFDCLYQTHCMWCLIENIVIMDIRSAIKWSVCWVLLCTIHDMAQYNEWCDTGGNLYYEIDWIEILIEILYFVTILYYVYIHIAQWRGVTCITVTKQWHWYWLYHLFQKFPPSTPFSATLAPQLWHLWHPFWKRHKVWRYDQIMKLE